MDAVRRGFCGAGSVARVCLVDRTVSVSSECLLRKSIFCSTGYAGNRTICCLRVPRRRLSSDRWIGRLVGRLPRHPDSGASRVVVADDTVRGRGDETAVGRTDTLAVVDVSTRSRSGEYVSVPLLRAVADTRPFTRNGVEKAPCFSAGMNRRTRLLSRCPLHWVLSDAVYPRSCRDNRTLSESPSKVRRCPLRNRLDTDVTQPSTSESVETPRKPLGNEWGRGVEERSNGRLARPAPRRCVNRKHPNSAGLRSWQSSRRGGCQRQCNVPYRRRSGNGGGS